jgi:hypothetical protein
MPSGTSELFARSALARILESCALIADLQRLGKKQLVYADNVVSLPWPFGAVGAEMPGESVDVGAKFHGPHSPQRFFGGKAKA